MLGAGGCALGCAQLSSTQDLGGFRCWPVPASLGLHRQCLDWLSHGCHLGPFCPNPRGEGSRLHLVAEIPTIPREVLPRTCTPTPRVLFQAPPCPGRVMVPLPCHPVPGPGCAEPAFQPLGTWTPASPQCLLPCPLPHSMARPHSPRPRLLWIPNPCYPPALVVTVILGPQEGNRPAPLQLPTRHRGPLGEAKRPPPSPEHKASEVYLNKNYNLYKTSLNKQSFLKKLLQGFSSVLHTVQPFCGTE